jgi:ribonuclease J
MKQIVPGPPVMEVCIHHGAHEIGGSCVEVREDGSRIILDVGRPLGAESGAQISVGPLFDHGPVPLGVFISHAHQDHWGLLDQVPPEIPIFMGAATERILREAAFWTTGFERANVQHLDHRIPIDVFPFRVTPFLNDHSAFDAYSLLVEGRGPRLFYTGDIRGHGRKQAIFEQLLRQPPAFVDAMLMEGTNIPIDGDHDLGDPSEAAVEAACVETFRSATGLALALYSAQNVDRLVTLYRATLRADRDFVMDLYTASIAEATGSPNIPRPSEGWPRVRVYVPSWQRARVKQAGEFQRVDRIKPFRVFEDDLAKEPSRYVLSFSRPSGSALAKAGALEGAVAVWSMWDGYLDEPRGQALAAFLATHDIPLVQHHTSGHASVEDLKRLVAAVRPGRIVPIHTFGGDRFDAIFEDVERRGDGEWWQVRPTPGISTVLRETISWRVVATMTALFPGRIRVTETHPGGGGLYDCLTLELKPPTKRCERIDLNRHGSAHVMRGDRLDSIPDFWDRCAASEDVREEIGELCRLAGLRPATKPSRPTTKQGFCFGVMADIAAALAHDPRRWRWEGPIDEYFWTLREDVLDRFPRVQAEAVAKDPTRYWILQGEEAPALIMDLEGVVHLLDGGTVRVGSASGLDGGSRAIVAASRILERAFR